MKVILLKEVKGRGGEGDVIDVKDGFANNYLIKEGYAVKATKGNLNQLEQRRANIAKREEVRLAEANELQEKLKGLKFKADVQIGDEGQLFGAVTSQMIADGIKKHADVDIDKRRIDIRKAIKTVGLHKAEVTIYRDIKAEIEVIVGAEDAEKFLEQLKEKNSKKRNKGQKDNKKNDQEENTENKSDEEKPAEAAEEKSAEAETESNNEEKETESTETAE